MRPCLESVLLEAKRQAGQRLVTSAGLGNNRQRRGRSLGVLGGHSEAADVGSLVRSGRSRGGGSEAAARRGA